MPNQTAEMTKVTAHPARTIHTNCPSLLSTSRSDLPARTKPEEMAPPDDAIEAGVDESLKCIMTVAKRIPVAVCHVMRSSPAGLTFEANCILKRDIGANGPEKTSPEFERVKSKTPLGGTGNVSPTFMDDSSRVPFSSKTIMNGDRLWDASTTLLSVGITDAGTAPAERAAAASSAIWICGSFADWRMFCCTAAYMVPKMTVMAAHTSRNFATGSALFMGQLYAMLVRNALSHVREQFNGKAGK